MTIDSYRGHTALFVLVREMKEKESVHIDTSTLLNIRGINHFFRDYVDNMFDPKDEIGKARIEWKQAIDELHEEKARCLQSLKGKIAEAEREVRRWTYHGAMMFPFFESIWSDIFEGEWPDLNKASEARQEALDDIEGQRRTAISNYNIVNRETSLLIAKIESIKPGETQLTDYPELCKKAEVASSNEKYYQSRCTYLFCKNRIFDLFGGRVAFEKLPVYDWPKSEGDIVEARLTAPIMRGAKNNFFIIRSVSKKEDWTFIRHQLFIDYGLVAPSWFSNGNLLNLWESYFINNGKARTKPQKIPSQWYNDFVKGHNEPKVYGQDEVEIPGSITRIANFIKNGGDGRYQIS